VIAPLGGQKSPRSARGAAPESIGFGNWLMAERGKRLLSGADRNSLSGKRNYAILAMLLTCSDPEVN
jgi:hypothetical protein